MLYEVITIACITHGACMVLTGEAFDPEIVMQVVQDEKCTSLYGVPLMFIAELNHPDFDKYDFSSLRTGIMAGASCPEATVITSYSIHYTKLYEIIDIDTWGGIVTSAGDISNILLNTPVETTAYVSSKAVSAGVLLTISCDIV